MRQAKMMNPVESDRHEPASKAEICRRISRHAQAAHAANTGYVADCPACRELYKQLKEAQS